MCVCVHVLDFFFNIYIIIYRIKLQYKCDFWLFVVKILYINKSKYI